MLLESRNQEFAGVKNAMESLREHLTQLGTTAAQDQERLRAEYEAQLAALREELSQRESALDERRTAFNDLEGRQSPVDNGKHEESAAREPEMTGSQMERSNKVQGAVETAQTKTGASFHPRSDRRWRSLGGWKRRWKTEPARIVGSRLNLSVVNDRSMMGRTIRGKRRSLIGLSTCLFLAKVM